MSTLKVNNLQVGQDATASNNFTLYQPAVPDGTVRLGVGNSGSVTDALILRNNSELILGTTSTGGALRVFGSSGRLIVGDTGVNYYDAPSHNFRDYSSFASRLYIKSDGSVGIGTDNPTTNFKLDVNGDLSLGEFGGTDNSFIDQKQNGSLEIINSGRDSNNGSIRINRFNNISGDTTYFRDFVVYDGKNNIVQFIDGSSGNVGIGTGDPTTKLNVVGSGYNQINIAHTTGVNVNKLGGITSLTYAGDNFSVFQTYASSGNGNNIYYGSADGSYRGVQNHYFYVNTSATATTGHSLALRITSTGNVGIGTNDPGVYKLNLNVTPADPTTGSPPSGSFLQIRGDNATVGYGPSLALMNLSGTKETGWRISAVSTSGNNGDLVFHGYAGGATYGEKLRITASGNVGIGTNNPSHNKLCVYGGVSIASSDGFTDSSGYSCRSWYSSYRSSGSTQNICQIYSNTGNYNTTGPAVRLIARYTYYQGFTGNNFLEVIICPRHGSAPAVNTITTIGTVPTINVSQSGVYATISVTYANDIHLSVFCEVYGQPTWYI